MVKYTAMFPRKIKVCDAFGIPVYLDFSLIILLLLSCCGGNGSGFGKPGFLSSHVYKIVDVAMAGCKVTFGYSEKEISALGANLVGICCWHNFTPFSLLYHN